MFGMDALCVIRMVTGLCRSLKHKNQTDGLALAHIGNSRSKKGGGTESRDGPSPHHVYVLHVCAGIL